MQRVCSPDCKLPLPPGVTEIRAVAAYHDPAEGRKELTDHSTGTGRGGIGKLGFVIGQRLFVPLIDPNKPRDIVLQAADLSATPSIGRTCRVLCMARNHGRQDRPWTADHRGCRHRDAGIHQRAERVDRCALEANHREDGVHCRGRGDPVRLGIEKLALITAIPSAFELVKFALFDAVEPQSEGKCEAAAMFLSAKKTLG